MNRISRASILGWLAAASLWTIPARAAPEAEGEVDLFELHAGQGAEHLLVQSTWTLGGGDDQFVFKLDTGSDTRAGFDDAEAQALYSRALGDNAALLVGVRHDFRSESDHSYAVAGIEGTLTPWLEGEHYFYLSERGVLLGSAQFVARWELAPDLALEPRVAVGWAAQDVLKEDVGAGLTDVEMSVRLRHQLLPYADVYVGGVQERLLGKTQQIAKAAGDPGTINRVVIGFGLGF